MNRVTRWATCAMAAVGIAGGVYAQDDLLNGLAPMAGPETGVAPAEAPMGETPVAAEPPADAPVEAPAPEVPVETPPAPAEGTPPAPPPPDLLDLLGSLQNVPPTPAPEVSPEPTPAPGDAPVMTPPAAAGAEAPVEAPGTADAVRELVRAEEIRRQAAYIDGRRAFATAQDALRREDYPQAFAQFTEALMKLPEMPQTAELRQRAAYGRAEAAYQQAVGFYKKGEYAAAKQQAAIASEDEAGHGSKVRSLLARISAREREAEARAAAPRPIAETEEVMDKQAQIAQLMERGKQWFNIEDYDRAEAAFEQILVRDPYHLDAMRFLKRIEERRLAASNTRRRATIEDLVQDVRERWNPPIRRTAAGPIESDPGQMKTTQPDTQQLREKLMAITIPSVNFRQATISDVINFLREASEANDPQKVGVNIILKLDSGGAAAPTPVAPTTPAEDLWGPLGGGPAAPTEAAPSAPMESAGTPTITLTLRRVTLFDAIKYVTEVAGLKFRLEGNAVIITPKDVVFNVITRLYPVMPSIMTTAVEKKEETGGQTGAGGGFGGLGGSTIRTTPDDDIKAMFERMGVPFPPGTSISYNSAISQLIVTNTAENLEILERILPQIDAVPKQVTIEARFIEVAQTDLDEFGFEWMLTDHWQLANKKGPGPLSSRERIQLNQNAANGGFTRGLRYFSGASDGANPAGSTITTFGAMTGTLFSISSVLTNPELTFVLHALSQRGGTDLLSAPRVTTRSGVNAQIQVVQEIIYPTEYEEQSVESQMDAAFRVPIPTAFETRETGVILNVTPTVGPDGYTIDLTLVPEVSELADWLDYGPPDRYPILQPVFTSRSVTTSVVLWDNQTLVLGGMIRDQVTRFDDKIPILGDIPLLGRLFRSKGERSSKRNLIVFVTARLVNPAGDPIHDSKDAVGERW